MTRRASAPFGSFLALPVLVGGLAATGCTAPDERGDATAAEGNGDPILTATEFEVDPHFPRTLPDNWIIGQVSGVAVDSRDHVWVLHRPGSLDELEAGAVQDPPPSMCCVPAPPVLEFDPDGNVVQAWGGEDGDGWEWPQAEHGIHVDHEDNVWIGTGLAPRANFVLKFTRDGEHLLTIGVPGASEGSNDVTSLGGPAAMVVDPEENEVYIADGYVNRRVIVFDAETGEYRRHWGAYGEEPSDHELDDYDPDSPPARQFRGPVHGITLSRDGLVYVTDRQENRIQVFEKDGTFVDEVRIRPETLSMGSTWDVALSRDPDQTYLYVPDGVNRTVWVVERSSLEVVNNFARGGRWAGRLGWAHNVDVDSRGNIFVSEVETGKRFQKFVPVR